VREDAKQHKLYQENLGREITKVRNEQIQQDKNHA
jgi:hypothetical protein